MEFIKELKKIFDIKKWSSNKKTEKEINEDCLCVRNSKGKDISGWCIKHHTDWL